VPKRLLRDRRGGGRRLSTCYLKKRGPVHAGLKKRGGRGASTRVDRVRADNFTGRTQANRAGSVGVRQARGRTCPPSGVIQIRLGPEAGGREQKSSSSSSRNFVSGERRGLCEERSPAYCSEILGRGRRPKRSTAWKRTGTWSPTQEKNLVRGPYNTETGGKEDARAQNGPPF